MTKPPKKDQQLPPAEADGRRDAIVRKMLATPPKPRKPSGKKAAAKRARVIR